MSLSTSRFIPFAIGLGITIGLYFYMKKFFIGKALRAVSQDAEASQLMGINKRNMYLISCGIGSGSGRGGRIPFLYDLCGLSGDGLLLYRAGILHRCVGRIRKFQGDVDRKFYFGY